MDSLTSFENVEKYALVFKSELEEMVSTSWSTVIPKVKSVKGITKGKNGEDRKGNDSKKKRLERMEKAKAKSIHVISSQGPKKVVRMANSAKGTTEC